jgi:hypothetical protein
MRNSRMDIVERSAHSKAKKAAAHGVRAGSVGDLATPWVMAHHRKEEKNKRTFE